MGGAGIYYDREVDPTGEMGELDITHLRFCYIAGYLLGTQLSWEQ